MRIKLSFLYAFILCITGSSIADESDVEIRPSGFAYYQIGQIERQSPSSNEAVAKPFEQKFSGRLTLEAVVKNQLRIIVGAEGCLEANLHDNAKKYRFDLKEAQGIYSFGDPERPWLQVASGYFPFKYNPEARNLGEYLFRTGTYPGFIITDFDNAKTRLMGFRVTGSILENTLNMHLLFTSEYMTNPYFDYSLSFLAGYKLPNNLVDVGGGVCLARLIPVVPDKTTKPSDIVLDEQNRPVVENGDTLRYTFKGTKVMARLTLDPKVLLPFSDIFGENDGKLYGEIAILGTKNYGTEYPEITERMPIMFGFNVPTFKIMDVLSFEAEYYGSDPEKKLDIPRGGSPKPDLYPYGASRTPWKWSFYAQKTITQGFAVKGLIGRDHFRNLNAGGNYDTIERMNGPGDWHYKLRIMYSF